MSNPSLRSEVVETDEYNEDDGLSRSASNVTESDGGDRDSERSRSDFQVMKSDHAASGTDCHRCHFDEWDSDLEDNDVEPTSWSWQPPRSCATSNAREKLRDQRDGDFITHEDNTTSAATGEIVAGRYGKRPNVVYTEIANKVPFFHSHGLIEQGEERVIRLPEEGEINLNNFLIFLHNLGDADEIKECEHTLRTYYGTADHHWFDDKFETHLVKIYVLADKLDSERQRNHVINLLRHKYARDVPSVRPPELLVNAGLEKSILWELLASVIACDLRIAAESDVPDPERRHLDAWISGGGGLVLAFVDWMVTRWECDLDRHILTLEGEMRRKEDCTRWHTHITTEPCNIADT
jgi:hypothetical protein